MQDPQFEFGGPDADASKRGVQEEMLIACLMEKIGRIVRKWAQGDPRKTQTPLGFLSPINEWGTGRFLHVTKRLPPHKDAAAHSAFARSRVHTCMFPSSQGDQPSVPA